MPYKTAAQFMRERARRLRLIAQTATTQNSPKLTEMAREMEELADKLDAREQERR